MSGNKIGGKAAAKTNAERHGSDFYKRIGALGGQKKVPKGFAIMGYAKASAAGKTGGTVSRRGKAVK